MQDQMEPVSESGTHPAVLPGEKNTTGNPSKEAAAAHVATQLKEASITSAEAQLTAQLRAADAQLRNMDFAGRDKWWQVISTVGYLMTAVLTCSAKLSSA